MSPRLAAASKRGSFFVSVPRRFAQTQKRDTPLGIAFAGVRDADHTRFRRSPHSPSRKTSHAHPRIRASLGAFRRRTRPARPKAREPLGQIAPLRNKNARGMAAHQRADVAIRLFVNAAGFSYWLAHPRRHQAVHTSASRSTSRSSQPRQRRMFGSGDSMVDWAAAKVPFLQKEIPVIPSPSS